MSTLMLLVSCDPTVNFDVELSGETVVPSAGLAGGVLDQLAPFGGFGNIDFADTQEFQNNDVTRENVQEARLVSLELSVVAPDGADLSFLEEIEFMVSADGIETATVASYTIEGMPESISLDTTGVDLAPYLQAETASITTEAEASPPPDDVTIRADLVINVTAGL